jgi:hypothetical protein
MTRNTFGTAKTVVCPELLLFFRMLDRVIPLCALRFPVVAMDYLEKVPNTCVYAVAIENSLELAPNLGYRYRGESQNPAYHLILD